MHYSKLLDSIKKSLQKKEILEYGTLEANLFMEAAQTVNTLLLVQILGLHSFWKMLLLQEWFGWWISIKKLKIYSDLNKRCILLLKVMLNCKAFKWLLFTTKSRIFIRKETQMMKVKFQKRKTKKINQSSNMKKYVKSIPNGQNVPTNKNCLMPFSTSKNFEKRMQLKLSWSMLLKSKKGWTFSVI